MGIVTQASSLMDEGFAWHRAMCIARNYPDVPNTIEDLTPGTQATIRDAAEQIAAERNERTTTIAAQPDPHATMPRPKPLRERIAERRRGVA